MESEERIFDKVFLHRKHNGAKSNIINNKFRAAQGSILWPALFLIVVNDLSNAVNCTPRLDADENCSVFGLQLKALKKGRKIFQIFRNG